MPPEHAEAWQSSEYAIMFPRKLTVEWKNAESNPGTSVLITSILSPSYIFF
jgi:hypothetical protein